MIEPPDHDRPENYQYMPRLMGVWLLAVVAFMAVGKSVYIEVIAVGLWCGLVAHLFLRFRARAAWSLLSAPLAFYWAWALWSTLHPAVGGDVYV